MSRRTQLLVALLALGLLMGGAVTVQQASAGAEVCDQTCVIMIEVDGLTPTDLDPLKMPTLWGLARQGALQGGGATGGDQVAGSGRNGYVWQAPRGVMSTGNAPAAASLLTGGYSEQHGIPADDFIDLGTGSRKYKRLVGPHADSATGSDEDDPQPITDPDAVTLFGEMTAQEEDGQHAWITGNPGLAPFLDVVSGLGESAVSWAPTTPNDGNPAFCPIPREPSDSGAPKAPETDQPCPAADGQTMNQATSRLQSAAAADVAFAYIHLASVGQTKLRDGNIDQALQDLDLAVGRFVQSYSTNAATRDKWRSTVLMVVGNHGYERTGFTRVPHPTQDERDLQSYLEGGFTSSAGTVPAKNSPDGGVAVVPQGTFATIYPTGSDPAKRKAVIRTVWAELSRDANSPGSVRQKCAAVAAAETAEDPQRVIDSNCIGDVLYSDPKFDLADAQVTANTIDAKYESWRYDHVAAPPRGETEGTRSGTSGELVVTANVGWAFGRAVSPDVTGLGDPEPITNAYPAAAGGPRNRAIAAFINGPNTVVKAMNRTTPWHPVTTGEDTGDERQQAATTDIAAANANPVDDANATGHELQPETVDFMPTAAALLRISVPQRQLVGRLLQEAFRLPLAFPTFEEDIGEPDPEPEPPPPPPPIIIPPPPPPPDPPPPPRGYDFYGLLRNLRALVVDAEGKNYKRARTSSVLSHMVIKADYGRPLTMSTLTFYRDALSRRDRREVGRCSALRRPTLRRSCLKRVSRGTSTGLKRDRKRCKRETDKSKRAACKYELKTKRRFERKKRIACVGRMDRRARRARRGKVMLKALRARCLVPLARFDPFTVKRGQVELKLKVPPAYGPTHVGLTVQEVRKMTRSERSRARDAMVDKDKPLFPYVGFGPKDGGIVAIKDANFLHKPKRKPRRARQRKE